MRETERLINKYKAQLPHMREKVSAALVLLLVAVVMMVSSSFAWIVLSTNPEIKGMNTTITANGNLEIALANGAEITLPEDSAVGDSGKDLLRKNITWGNLINLGDPVYGLENIVLRPATLNTNSLLESPLYAAGYGADGRVDTLESDFAFAGWDAATQKFLAQNVNYGVRTIASVIYGDAGGDTALANRVESANIKIKSAQTDLQNIATSSQIDDLGVLMQQYVQEMVNQKLGSAEKEIKIDPEHLDSIYEMMTKLKGNMELIADALAETYNIQLIRRMGNGYYEANKFTGDQLLNLTQAEINAKIATKNDKGEAAVVPANKNWLTTLRTKYTNLKADIAKLDALRGRTDVIWENLATTAEEDKKPELYPIVNNVVNIATSKIDGTALGSLGGSAILDLAGKSSVVVEVQSGYLKDVDQLSGTKVQSKSISLKVSVYGMSKKMSGTVITYASNAKNTEKFMLATEYNQAISGATNYKGTDPIAKDTFGMALDFFVRTNSVNSHLILQGSPVYEEREEIVTRTINNKSYNIYTITFDGEQYSAYLEGDTYYYYDLEYGVPGDAMGTTEEITNATLLKETVKYVVGYNGVNRVWDSSENVMLDGDSTTQGAGSCYTFYASSPEDQQKSLMLLSHFRIAFVDQNGNLLATAYMDVDNRFEATGKVTVPLVLSTTSNSFTGSDGNPIYTITSLNQNEATFISALVYLDGVGLTNDQVLAAGEIQGQLNLQFGTTADLDAMDDPILMESKCSVSAVMEGDTTVPFDTPTPALLTKTVVVTVDGYTPSRVEAYFLREINSTQGIRQTKMVFEVNAEGKWVGQHTFESPGRYILREVFLDGVAYELSHEPLVFSVEGFTINSLTCVDNGKTFMTTNKNYETSLSLTFASNDPKKLPTSVKGAFIHQDTGNRTTVYFTRKVGGEWVGTADFRTSGDYVMDYLELDDQYFGLEERNHISLKLYLGLTASVYADHTNFALETDEIRDINMSLIIKDDSGERIGGLDNVWLYYSNNGSGVQEQGLSEKMVWNPSAQAYQGIFRLSKAGIYNYSYVSIDIQGENNSLNEAAIAPTITAISSNPPKYVSKEGFGEVFALNNSAKFAVRMKNADSATLDAALKNESGATYYVRGVMSDEGDEQVFTFVLPIIEGNQSGTWTLDRLYMTNVYGGRDNTLYDGSIENGPDTATETKPLYTVADNYYIKWLEWTIDDITAEGETTETTIRVVSDINVAFSDSALNTSKEFGKTDGKVTATFGTTHTLGNLELDITAGSSKKPLSDYGINVTKIKLNYSFDSTSAKPASGGTVTNTFGSYTMDSASWTNLTSTAQTSYELLSNNGSKYTIKPNENTKNISIAGMYKTDGKVEITLEDESGKQVVIQENINAGNAPSYTVFSVAPTVKFTETDPAVGTSFKVQKSPGADETENKSNTISADGLSATCYFEAKSSGCDCNGFDASYITVELVSGGNKFKSGSFVIKSAGTASDMTFTFSSTSVTSKQAVGSGGNNPTYIGTNAKGTQIILTDNNDISYTFTLPVEKQLSLTCTR
ncbi:MAG: hypothetical protein IJD71_04515 [Clostridia bacterium]|nr:hypothetical protein [Clostridia bacterium]